MKINVAVLFGGKSVEHEVSVISALQAMRAMDAGKYEIYPVYITKGNEFYHGAALRDVEGYRDLPALLKKCGRVGLVAEGSKTYLESREKRGFLKSGRIALIDLAFPIVHGTNVEDGALQGYLKTLNLPFVGCDVLASAVCMDKFSAKALLRQGGFPVLDCLRFEARAAGGLGGMAEAVEARFPYPVVVKPVNLGSSVGIGRASDRAGLMEALETAFMFAGRVIAEPAVENLKEVNCAVLGDADAAEASECEEPYATEEILSYSDKYMDGGKQGAAKGMAGLKRRIPADISSEMRAKIRQIATESFKFLDCCGVARADFLIDTATGGVWLNEFNTIPGSLSFYLWEPTGLSYADLLDRLIALALKRRRVEEEIIYSFDTNILSTGGGFGRKGKI